MRTGAIFARGSCRALKWMALVGMVFALGAGQAFAQAAEFRAAEWTPESAVIKINMTAAVWTRGGPETAEDFTVTWTQPAGSSAEGVMHAIPGARGGAATEFTITLDKVVPTDPGTVVVAYDGPDAADTEEVNDRGILDNSAGHAPTTDNDSITTNENTTIAPTVLAVDAMTFENGEEIDAFQLPAAMGNAQFTYLVSNLPAGLTWDANGADNDSSSADAREDDRMVAGTPAMVTDGGAHAVTYTVTDSDGQATSIIFMITVNDAPDAPKELTVLPTPRMSGSLTVNWEEPDLNNSELRHYVVEYREKGTPRWVKVPENVEGTTTDIDKLTNGTEYEVRVQAVNWVDEGAWTEPVIGTPMAPEDLPAAPTQVTVESGGQRMLVVKWGMGSGNGSDITGYDVRLREVKTPDWTIREVREAANISARSEPFGDLKYATQYEAQVRTQTSNGFSDWSTPAQKGTTGPAPVIPERKKGVITGIALRGDVEVKNIGASSRTHVMEGRRLQLEVTAEWSHAELTALYGDRTTAPPARVVVRINPVTSSTNWYSPIDDRQDVHFPDSNATWVDGHSWATVDIELPPKPKGHEFPSSETLTRAEAGLIDIHVLEDAEAENDAFYVDVPPGRSDTTVELNSVQRFNMTRTVVIEDKDPQSVTVTRPLPTGASPGPTEIYENRDTEFTITATPRREDLPLNVQLSMLDLSGVTVSAAEISLSTANVTLNPARDGSVDGNKRNVTVHLPASDGNRVDDPYELQASVNVYSLASGGFETIAAATHAITVLDIHRLPEVEVSPATGSVKEGETVELTVEINRNPTNTPAVSGGEVRQYTDEEVSVMLTLGGGTASASDFTVMTNPVTFPKRTRGSYTAEMTVEVMATADNELDDGETLVLDAMVKGADAKNGSEGESTRGVATLTIEEGTGKLVYAKSTEDVEAAIYAAKEAGMGDDMFSPGEMIEVMAGGLFNHAEGVTLSYTAGSDSDAASASVSGGTVMVTAKEAGMAHITITAHASAPSGVDIVDQTDPREASIRFPVEVGLEALSIMLSGPEDMNVVEGGMGATVTATANRAVTEDVTVMLMRDRAMSTAGDADFKAEPIVIATGKMSGTTMVMAVEDDMMESVDNMAEELVLYGMAEGMAGEVTGHVKLYLWDAAVPALPVIAQLLLAAFLALGGYRRYLRR